MLSANGVAISITNLSGMQRNTTAGGSVRPSGMTELLARHKGNRRIEDTMELKLQKLTYELFTKPVTG